MSKYTVKNKYGFLPLSIMTFDNNNWRIEKNLLNIDLIRRESGAFRNYPFSKFSFGLSEFVIKYWSNTGDVILDQYMGWGIRGVVALRQQRIYVGYDISPQMYNKADEYIRKLSGMDVRTFFDSDNRRKFELVLGDGTKLDRMVNNCIDLVFTCPPYYNLEKYEDVPRQLSSAPSYELFLGMIKDGLMSAKRVLKPDGFVVYVVADFRAESELKNFHGDLIEIGKDIGLKHWDTVISVLRSPLPAINVGQCDRLKYTSKKHEYIIVFKKVIN